MDDDLDLNLDDLDITTEEIDFEGIDEDLARFQQDALVREALEKGIDLRQYQKQIESDLTAVEISSIEDYLREADSLAQLHREIAGCDSVLESMENMLSGFQADLGNISSEIKTLQHESYTMNMKLKNRQAAQQKLSSFIDSLVLPPALIRGVTELEVNEAYLEFLLHLGDKVQYLAEESKRQAKLCGENGENVKTLACIEDIRPNLDKLCLKAVFKVRDFLVGKIQTLKKPKTNIQIVQQNVLLKFRYFQTFIQQHAPPAVGQEVKDVYVETVAKLYFGYFKTYLNNMEKLELVVAGKSDVLGEKEGMAKSLFGSRSSAAGKASKPTIFALGDRAAVLSEVGTPALVAHVAAERKEKFSFEVIWRSVMAMLVDTSTSEYLFLLDFFGAAHSSHLGKSSSSSSSFSSPSSSAASHHAAEREPLHLFSSIFSKVLDIIFEFISNWLEKTHDVLGTLLVIRLNMEFNLQMNKRRIPVLDSFLDRLNLLLWPKFKSLFDANLESIKHADAKALSFSNDTQPHYVVRRYADFCASLLFLNASSHYNEILRFNLSFLRSAMESFIDKLSRAAFASSNTRDQALFLVNNYNSIVSTLLERGPENALDSTEDGQRFRDLLQNAINRFVEEQLTEKFGRMIAFVRKGEPKVDKEQPLEENKRKLDVSTDFVEQIAKDFTSSWKPNLEQINEEIVKAVPDYRNGKLILKQVLTQLLLYYTRFTSIVDICFEASVPFRNQMVSSQAMMFEFKRYSE